MSRGIGLLSGGLDSILAVRLLTLQEVEVLALTFITPFFGSTRAEAAARQLAVPLRIVDISAEHLELVKNPPHGYGRTMNPCIDCHALMFHHAGRVMESEGYDFLFSGEVLNERPMSQNRQSLDIVARSSGFADFIVRPLSAKLLPETPVEHKGLVDRSRLLDIEGRSRKRQMALAAEWGITDYPTPAGGCLLTEEQFSLRLGDLFKHDPDADVRKVELLKLGRHFRLTPSAKLVCGRNHAENERLQLLAGPQDTVLSSSGVPGPTAVLCGTFDEETLALAVSLVVRYCDVPAGTPGRVRVFGPAPERFINAQAAPQELIDQFQIK